MQTDMNDDRLLINDTQLWWWKWPVLKSTAFWSQRQWSKHWKMALCWHLKDQRLCSDARGQLIHWPDNTQHMENTAACPQPQLSAKPCHMKTLSVVSGLWLTKCTAFTCKLLTDAFIHGDLLFLHYMNRTHDHYYLCSKKKKKTVHFYTIKVLWCHLPGKNHKQSNYIEH